MDTEKNELKAITAPVRIGDVFKKLTTLMMQKIVNEEGEPAEMVMTKLVWKWRKCDISLSLQEIANGVDFDTNKEQNRNARELFIFLHKISNA